MAQWKETLEPYIKVNERIRTTTIVPTAGEDLIIGATLISDSGPSYPVLITSQREFLNVFASQDITKGYLESLNDFYDDGTGVKSDVASTMWLNAYRLAGSTNMLIVRATKGADMNYVVPVNSTDDSSYIVRDGQLLKKVSPFSLTNDRVGLYASGLKESGWAISINEIGIIGNLVGDDGPLYEYFAADLRELVEYLNGTSKFFSPKYKFLKLDSNNVFKEIKDDTTKPDSVYFEEVYLAEHFLDKQGFDSTVDDRGQDGYGALGTTYPSGGHVTLDEAQKYGTKSDGLAYLIATNGQIQNQGGISDSNIIDLNSASYSGWNTGSDNKSDYYFVNTYNSNSNIQIRIRRFNHDAVILRDDIKPTIGENDPSPYDVIEDVITQYSDPELSPSAEARIRERDFYEVAVLDPSLDKDPLSFCVGNISGRGDLTLDELNDTLKMINLHINSMEDLDLSYYSPNYSAGGSGGGQHNTPPISMGDNRQLTPTSNIPGADELGRLGINGGEVTIISASDVDAISDLPLGSLVGVIDDSVVAKSAYVPVVRNSGENDGSLEVDNRTISDNNGEVFRELPNGSNIQDSSNALIKSTSLVVKQGDLNYRLNREATSYIVSNITVDSFENFSDNSGNNYVKLMGYDLDDNNIEDDITLYMVTRSSGDGTNQIHRQLGIGRDGEETSLLTVTPDDLMRSISAITEDEVYTTEGLTDLGNTDLKFQTYLCNMAKNENYFYPISTLYSTNYLAIANYRTRLAQDSHKLYTSAPWDIDSGTVGFKFHACPSVIYWEAVSKNRSMNREFASVFGFSGNGQVLYTNPVTEFTKKQRQLLLSKQVNTVMWNTQSQTWNMNDCYTMTSENHILNEDGNSRLFIRINKAIPVLLKSLIGRKLGPATYSDAEDILKYWFERTIVPMQYSVSGYKITISTLEANDDQARRQNKMYVLVECLFPRSLKYVIVYSDALDMGMEFVGEIV